MPTRRKAFDAAERAHAAIGTTHDTNEPRATQRAERAHGAEDAEHASAFPILMDTRPAAFENTAGRPRTITSRTGASGQEG